MSTITNVWVVMWRPLHGELEILEVLPAEPSLAYQNSYVDNSDDPLYIEPHPVGRAQ